MTLPLLLALPHAGTLIPPEVRAHCALCPEDIVRDSDEGAAAVYRPLADQAAAFVETDIARAVVDLNRAPDDFSRDGVIKTHTCWDVPVYRIQPDADLRRRLITAYHQPYHHRLSRAAAGAMLGIDCHTMAAAGPPTAADAGEIRPAVCLSDAGGSCPCAWFTLLKRCLEETLQVAVMLNTPFRGGYTIRSHAHELPWVQLEFSRAPFLDAVAKSTCLHRALCRWCTLVQN